MRLLATAVLLALYCATAAVERVQVIDCERAVDVRAGQMLGRTAFGNFVSRWLMQLTMRAIRVKVVLGLLPIPDSDPGASPSALFLDLVPTATATLPAFVPPPFNVEFTGELLTEGLQFRISSSGVSIPTLSGRSLDLGSGIKLITAPPSMLLVGSPYSSRLEIVAWSAALRLKGSRVDPEVEIELGWEQARLVIDEGDGDGFLQKILPIKTGVIEFGVSVI